MSKVIAICNQKGGVGKTTTVISMGAALAEKEYKVLLIDVDDSGNASLTKILGAEREETITDLMLFKLMDRDITGETGKVIERHREGFDLLPADSKLASITNFLTSISDDKIKRTVLKDIIGLYKENYDFILIDAAPALNLMSVNIFVAADEVIIVSQTQGAAEGGIVELISSVSEAKEKLNPDIIITGLLLTMYDGRTNYNKSMANSMKRDYTDLGMKVFNVKIPRGIAAEEYVKSRSSLLTYAPKSKPAMAYREFVEEYLEDHKEVMTK